MKRARLPGVSALKNDCQRGPEQPSPRIRRFFWTNRPERHDPAGRPDRMRGKIFWLLIGLALFSGPGVLLAEPLILDDTRPDFQADGRLEMLTDPSGTMDLQQAMGSPHFKAIGPGTFNAGFSSETLWLRLPVRNLSTEPGRFLLEIAWSFIDSLVLYYVVNGRVWRGVHTGNMRGFDSRSIEHRNFLFSVPSDLPRDYQIYMRIASEDLVVLPITFYDRDAFWHRDRTENQLLGFYYGMVGVIFVLNLFLFLTLRERVYLYYLAYCAAMGLFHIFYNGMAYGLWPESPVWNKYGFVFSFVAARMTALLFIMEFLELRKRMPATYRLCQALLGLDLVGSLLTMLFGYQAVGIYIQATIFPGLAFAVYLGIAGVRRGFRPAWIYLIGFAVLIGGFLILNLRNIDFLPHNYVTHYTGQFGSALELALLSLALADRISVLRRRLEYFNERLEKEVQERTGALNRALADLRRRDQTHALEMELAHSIQNDIMPPESASLPRFRMRRYSSTLVPVGGDYFDVFRLADGLSGAAIADAAGHGVSAALVTCMAKACFREAAGAHSPREMLLIVNDILCRVLRGYEYLTAAVFLVSADRELRYSSAGHRPSLFLSRVSNSIEQLDTRGILLGIFGNDDLATRSLEETTRTVSPGDRLFLYTDGLTDATNDANERFGEERLADCLMATREQGLNQVAEELIRKVTAHRGANPPEDDASFAIIEFL